MNDAEFRKMYECDFDSFYGEQLTECHLRIADFKKTTFELSTLLEQRETENAELVAQCAELRANQIKGYCAKCEWFNYVDDYGELIGYCRAYDRDVTAMGYCDYWEKKQNE